MANQHFKSYDHQNADELFEQFVRELDAYSTNGVVKQFDVERLWPMAEHYILQCSFEERVELEERIRLLLVSKYNYSLVESKLKLSDKLEKTIREKIQEMVNSNLKNAGKFAGLLVNWAIMKPIQVTRQILQPVLTNTVLTYAVAVHPTFVNSVDIHVRKEMTKPVVIEVMPESEVKNYELDIKNYTHEDIFNLTEKRVDDNLKSAVKASATKTETIVIEKPVSVNSVASVKTLDIEPSRVLKATITKDPVIRIREIRPVGDIQRILGENEIKFMNCYQTFKKTQGLKSNRLSLKFVISPKGFVKTVQVMSSGFNQEMTQRVGIQIKSLRFAEIDIKFGDQTVYHTFYF